MYIDDNNKTGNNIDVDDDDTSISLVYCKMTVWLLTFNFIHFMAAFWAVFTFGGSGPDITAHGSLDLKQEIQIQMMMTT
jgi:hypothetical protein